MLNKVSPSTSHLRAIIFALTGFTMWVLADASMKVASEANLPPYEIIAFLGFVGVFFMVVKAVVTGSLNRLSTANPKKQIGRAVLSLMINLCNAVALKHIPLTMFYVTVFTAPIIISLLAALFLHEHLNRLRIVAIISGFVGVVIAINPFGNAGNADWIGYAAALTGVFFFAISTLWVRLMSQHETTDSLAFFTCLVELVVGSFLMIFHADPVSFKMFLILVVMGLFCVGGNILNYMALKHTTAATVSQFHYTQIIIGAIIGYFIWNEIPSLHLLFGTCIIISAGLVVIMNKPAAAIKPTTPF